MSPVAADLASAESAAPPTSLGGVDELALDVPLELPPQPATRGTAKARKSQVVLEGTPRQSHTQPEHLLNTSRDSETAGYVIVVQRLRGPQTLQAPGS